jgi:hypothetical protein
MDRCAHGPGGHSLSILLCADSGSPLGRCAVRKALANALGAFVRTTADLPRPHLQHEVESIQQELRAIETGHQCIYRIHVENRNVEAVHDRNDWDPRAICFSFFAMLDSFAHSIRIASMRRSITSGKAS